MDCINNEYGTKYTKDDVLEWDLEKVFPGKNPLKYFDTEGFFYRLEPYEDAIYYTKKLIEDGFDIVVTTASPVNGLKDKALWLQKHFPHIPIKNLVLAWRKDCVKGDVMLDDALHNITTSICERAIIFDQPWNRDNANGYDRVKSWKEFYELLCKIYKEEVA